VAVIAGQELIRIVDVRRFQEVIVLLVMLH
jgi:hypothetical protein